MKPTETGVTALAARLMQEPTAPYFEEGVQAVVRSICAEEGLKCREDSFGNIYVETGRSGGRPLVLAAHLDHPGFEILRRLSNSRFLARFRGGVPESYFQKGTPVRLFPGDTPARLGKSAGMAHHYELVTSQPCPALPKFAVWDLKSFGVRGGRIVGRACDDLVGSASVLATLIRLKKARTAVHVIGMLARAEEVGFHGALVAAAQKELPAKSLVISLETSRELPGVKMGKGVIVRVGDKASVFDSKATRFLSEVAAGIQQPRGFAYQRALMGGGTCEATAYQEFGYTSAAVCVALGNYHNCGPRNRIAEEYVSVADAEHTVDLLVESALRMKQYNQITGRLSTRLKTLLKEARTEQRQRASL